MPSLQQPASFSDLRRSLTVLPPPDEVAASAARRRNERLTKPPGSLGRLEELVQWLAAIQSRYPPKLERVRVAVFAGWHGVVRQGVSAYPAAVTGQMVANFEGGGAAINQLARVADAELVIRPIEPGIPTGDLAVEPAMDEAACMAALCAGMDVVEEGLDLLALGEMGIGNTTSASALCSLLYGEPGEVWAGPGTGLDTRGVRRKAEVVNRACVLHAGAVGDPLQVLRCVGGHEIAAMTGAVIAARLRRVPVLLDGFVCGASAAIAAALAPDMLAHCRAAHRSAEPGHRRLLEPLQLSPLLDLGMRLGEASGAALAIPLLRAALACHIGMATFDEAGVSDRRKG